MWGPVAERSFPSVDRGQAETIGTVLILALTLIGATATLAVGATVLDDARTSSQEDGIEHAMTQLDSRAAMVALGDSDSQRVKLTSTESGSYTVAPETGWVRVTHHNFNNSGSDEVIYNESLGAIIYQNGDKRIGYQGGGVWAAVGNTSRMISPPEFHYQSATLTFPVIRVNGSSSVGGDAAYADISRLQRAQRIFPNASRSYPGSNGSYVNPIRDGNVTVTVQSEFYEAWAEYFRTRTSGNVTVDHPNETTTVELIVKGATGSFQMPADGNSVNLRSSGGGHTVTEFSITLFSDDDDSADFSNLKWSLTAEKGGKQFEVHLRDNSGGTCGGDVRATIYYTENNGADYQSWTNGSAFQYECETAGQDFNDDGDTNDKRLVANFTSTTPLTYDAIKGGDGIINAFSVKGSDDFTDPTTFDEHQDSVPWESMSFSSGDERAINDSFNHYMALMGSDVELTVADANGNTVNEEASTGSVEQKTGTGEFITFLHITENRISVEFD